MQARREQWLEGRPPLANVDGELMVNLAALKFPLDLRDFQGIMSSL
jgi:hypothetical protein